MKVGDKVHCKKSRVFGDEFVYIKEKTYVITEIKNNFVYVSSSICGTKIESFLMIIKCNKKKPVYYKFYDYFFTEQELRKQKLKRLNESNL
jgi:predicted methyltransferase